MRVKKTAENIADPTDLPQGELAPPPDRSATLPAFDLRSPQPDRLINAIGMPIAGWQKGARLQVCNEAYERWSGRSREALLGRSLQEIYGDAAWQAAEAAFGMAFTGATPMYQLRLNTGPETGRWARIQLFPQVNADGETEAVFSVATDIHDDVMAREALNAARMRLARFTENIPYPLNYVDRNLVLRFVNKAYTDATEEPAKNLLGRPVALALGAKSWAEQEPYFHQALKGESVQLTRLVSAGHEAQRWMRTSYVPDVGENDAVLGVYTVTVDVHELTVTQEKLKRRVERDALTDVLSRRTMMDRIEASLADARQNTVALFFIDLDGFKAVNDQHGHHQGDALLVAVGSALQATVRSEDAVGRFGGDEFLVLAPVRDASGARTLALHLLEGVHRAAASSPALTDVSASIGYALSPADANSPLSLLQLADDAMYAAKRAGKGQVVHCASIGFDDTR